MGDAPTTHVSLLVRLRDAQDAAAWARFVELYGPLIYGYARRQGLQDVDAADVTQEVLRTVSRALPRFEYDPARGSFRGWLFTVVRNELRSFWSGRKRSIHVVGGTTAWESLERTPENHEEEPAWNEEYQRRLFLWAAEQIRRDFREATWQAFWLTAVEGKSGKETAERLGMTAAAVYLARGRILARLKEQIAILEAQVGE